MRRQFATAATLALGAWTALAGQAAASYSDPETISDPSQSSGYPAIAIAGGGNATVAWTGGGPFSAQTEARRIGPDGSLGPILELSETGAQSPVDLGVSGDGSATVVWRRHGIELARISPAGDPGPVVRITEDTEGVERIRPKIAVAADGTAIVAWVRFGTSRRKAEAAVVSPDGDVGPITRLARADGISAPNIAIDERGTATVVWRAYRKRKKRRVIAGARLDRTGDLQRLGRISGRTARNAGEQVAVGPSGEATVVWRHYGGRYSVQSVRISAAGKISRRSLLARSSFGSRYPYFTSPGIAYGADGHTHASWVRHNGRAGARLWSSPLDRRGAARDPLPISKRDRRASAAELAIDSTGVVHFVWDSFNDGDEAIAAGSRAPGGEVSAAERLSPPGETSLTPRIAVGPDDRPLIAWWQLRKPSRVELARGSG